LCFIAHQVYYLQDVLVDTLIAIVRSVNSSIIKKHKNHYYEQRKERLKTAQQAINMAKESYQANAFSKRELRKIIKDATLSDGEKVVAIAAMIDSEEQSQAFLQNQLAQLNTLSQNLAHKQSTYDFLEMAAASVQRKLNPVVIHLNFDEDQSDADLIEAIQYFKSKTGNISQNAPQGFLTKEETEKLYDEKGKFRISLYKMFLFKHLYDGIKAGRMNLSSSYKFKSFSEYLIPFALWKSQHQQLLERASLTNLANFEDVLTFLKKQLGDTYEQTNKRIIDQVNKHIRFRKDGTYSVHTPKLEEVDNDKLAIFFPQDKYVPLLEVLTTVDSTTNFLDAFQPWKERYEKTRPEPSAFLACIIGYGCNIGIHKMEKISRNRAKTKLTNIINWYFAQEHIDEANTRIIDFMNGMELPSIYRDNDETLHTSSDGQNVSVAVDSLLASHSFKYFGKGKGVSVYGFIDQRNFPFYSMVNSPADRESTFVFDGLLHNDNIKSTIHSTDTHGQSEAAFALAYLLGFKLAPRISKLSDCTLYSFEKREIYLDKDYKILPNKYINTELIEKHWDEILHFVATVKLKVCTPSQLFKRLNSYSKQHPLYQALKELGHVIRTIFILEYIDDVELRQAIEKQLNKIENSNKFNKAVCVGEEEFQQGTKEEMEIVDACRRLIKSVLICWNYLYLSKKINQEQSLERKQQMIQSIRSGSIVTWKHFNLEGFYDFADDQMEDSFDLTN
ncbi:MAG: Tn3 family transposase, partial [Bacteroidota bacterium]